MSEKHDLEPLLSTQQSQLTAVTTQGDGIDNKSLAILAADVALLIFAIDASGTLLQTLLVLAPIACSIIFTLLTLQPKQYIGASVDLDDHPEYLAMDRETLLLQLLSDTQAAIKHNTMVNSKHWRTAVVAAASALVGGVGLFVLL